MNLDLSILAAVALFAAVGFVTGAIQQLSHWIGLAAALLLAKPAAAALAPALAARMGWPPSLTSVGLSVVSMPVVLLAATLASRGILNAIIPGEQRNMADRLAGLVLGGGKIAVIAWAALSAVLAFEKPLAKHAPGAATALRASKAGAFTREHGFFVTAAPPALEKLKALSAMRDDPKLPKALREDAALMSLLGDPALKEALEKGEAALRDDPRLKKLLEDPELAKKLEALAAER